MIKDQPLKTWRYLKNSFSDLNLSSHAVSLTALAKCLEYKCKNIQWLQLWWCIKGEISRFWVQVQSKMAMKSEWKKYCVTALPAKLMTCGLWGKSTWTSAFFCDFFSFIHTVLQSHVCNRAGKKIALYTELRSFFLWQQSTCTAFIHSVELMEQTWTLHWQWNTREHTHPRLRVFVQRHRWTVKASRVCVFVYERVHGLNAQFKGNIKHEWVCISVIALTSISLNKGVNTLCWPAHIKELCVYGCVCVCVGDVLADCAVCWCWAGTDERLIIKEGFDQLHAVCECVYECRRWMRKRVWSHLL